MLHKVVKGDSTRMVEDHQLPAHIKDGWEHVIPEEDPEPAFVAKVRAEMVEHTKNGTVVMAEVGAQQIRMMKDGWKEVGEQGSKETKAAPVKENKVELVQEPKGREAADKPADGEKVVKPGKGSV